MKKIVFASHNEGKVKEIKHELSDLYEILSLTDIGCDEDIPETRETIEGNALLKANYIAEKYGQMVFSDDTGLEIEALNGAPGVYSARYAGTQKNSNDNMDLVLKNLEGNSNRKAQFKTVIALQYDGNEKLFSGITKGIITKEKRGTNGFGYDPIFIPKGTSKTFGEMNTEEKSVYSHRAKAVKKLVAFLKNELQ